MLSLHIREVKDGYEPTRCTNDYPPSTPGDESILPTLMWKPAHPLRAAIERNATYPLFAPI
jgi:hypothetical protein